MAAKAMRQRVDDELGAIMDNGVRVNPALHPQKATTSASDRAGDEGEGDASSREALTGKKRATSTRTEADEGGGKGQRGQEQREPSRKRKAAAVSGGKSSLDGWVVRQQMGGAGNSTDGSDRDEVSRAKLSRG